MIPFWSKKRKGKKAFVLKNGGILLEQLITTFDGKRNPIRNFSFKELKLATNNYDTMNYIMRYGYFKLYKGFLLDYQISVMVFPSKNQSVYDQQIYDCWILDQQIYDCCINNIVFASQMCHKHILKLIGCCLETEVPILVFESLVKYETLDKHIFNHLESHLEPLSWRQRLKIAMEISHTFAYLHVGFPRPIVYFEMSSSRFLLDEHCVPKLFDFSHAQCIPEGETQIKTTKVTCVIGNMAPEVYRGVLDEKCDVFGFGTLLLELLTGKRTRQIFSSETEDKDPETEYRDWCCNLVKKLNEDNWFIETVDPIIVGDGLCPEIEQQLKVCKELVVKCLPLLGEYRPTMIDVAKQLRQLYLSTS